MSTPTLLLICLLVCLLCWSANASSLPESPRAIPRPPAPDFAPAQPARVELGRGALGLFLEEHELPLVDGALLVRGGSLAEPDARLGLTSLLADALREGGGAGAPGTELDEWLDSRAASIECGAESDALSLRFHCLAGDLPELLARLQALLAAPLYPAEVVEQARARLQAALARRNDSAAGLAERGLLRAVYGWQSAWGREATPATVAAITREELLAAHAQSLCAARVRVGLSGDFDSAQIEPLLRALVAALPAGAPGAAPEPARFDVPAATRIWLMDRPGVSQCELRLAAPGIRRLDERYPELLLWSHALGIGMTSRLMARVRTELGLAYSVGAFYRSEWDVPGRLYAWCGTRNEQAGQALAEIIEALQQAALEELPAEELDAARERVLNAEVFRCDTPFKVLLRALELELHGAPADFHERTRARLKQLTPKQVLAATRSLFAPQQLAVVAAGPLAEIRTSLERVAECRELGLEPGARGDAAGAALAEKLLGALGGRAAWAALETLALEGRMRVAGRTGEVEVELAQTRELGRGALRIEQRNPSGSFTTVLAGARGFQAGPIGRERLGAPELARLARFESRSLYRLLHELASSSARIAARAGAQGELEIHSDLGLECALELAADGLPRAVHWSERGQEFRYEYASWQSSGPYRYAARVVQSQPQGTLTVARWTPNASLPPDSFASPFED